jgi:hypothetical protein
MLKVRGWSDRFLSESIKILAGIQTRPASLDSTLTCEISIVAANEAVDLLSRLHVEDKQHMTRTVCLDVFYKFGGVKLLLQLLSKCCESPTEYSEALQGILWWFERTTSLKRMHNAQITYLLQRQSGGKPFTGVEETVSEYSIDDSGGVGSLDEITRFDAVGLVSSLQGEFASTFLPYWRSDECILKITAKASASLLKAFTHVLEPNEKVVVGVLSSQPPDGSGAPGTGSVFPGTASLVLGSGAGGTPPPTGIGGSQSPVVPFLDTQRGGGRGLLASILRRATEGTNRSTNDRGTDDGASDPIWRPTVEEVDALSTETATGNNASPPGESVLASSGFGSIMSSGGILSALLRSFSVGSSLVSSSVSPQTRPSDMTPRSVLLDALFSRSSAVSLYPYMSYAQVFSYAKDVASDFMDRTLLLGSSECTSAIPAQTHIADVCVRLSHNKVLKLGRADDEEMVRVIQGLAGNSLAADVDRIAAMMTEVKNLIMIARDLWIQLKMLKG